MALNFRKFLQGINIFPKTTSTVSSAGDIDFDTTNNKLNIHNGTTASPLVSEAHSATLTNKTIDADQNSLSNIDNADIKAGAAIDRSKLASGTADHVLINNGSGVLSSEAQLATSRGGTGVNSSASFPSSGTVATVPSSGVVKSNGSVLSSGNIDLTSEVTGILPSVNGGTGVNSSATFPTSGIIVTEAATETLTNKTIDGTTNTLQNIPSSAVDLASATTLDEATTNTASTVNIGTGTGANVINIGGANSTVNFTGTVNNNNVTNLNVADKLITINDGGGAGSGGNSGFEIEENGSATGYLQTSTDRNSFTFKAPNTAGVATLTPGATSDVVTMNAASQVLTNKDIDGGTASNSKRITLPSDTLANLQALTRKAGTIVYATDTQKEYVDNGSNLVAVGTGGLFNYFPTGDAESGLTIGVYADGGTSPTDGQGGGSLLTAVLTGINPLAGTKSFLIGSGNTGDGFSILSETINPKDYGKVFALTVDMKHVVGIPATPAAGDFGLFVLDVNDSNRQLMLQPNYIVDKILTTPSRMTVYVQIPMDATQLRFCFHQRQAIGTTYYTQVEFSMTEQISQGYAPIQTDWSAVTPVFSQFGTVTALSIYNRQDGKDLLLRGNFTTGTLGTGSPYIEMPDGLKIDDTQYPSGVVSILGRVPRGVGASAGGTYSVNLVYNGSDNTKIYFSTGNNGDAPTTVVSNATLQFNSSEIQMIADCRIAIKGWSSATQSISSYDGRVVVARLGGDPASASSGNPIIFPTSDFDTHSGYNASTGEYTVKVAGKYKIGGCLDTAQNLVGVYVYKNGSSDSLIGITDSGAAAGVTLSGIVDCVVGDILTIRPNNTLDVETGSKLTIEMLSGAQQISAGQRIEARYDLSTNSSLSANQVVPFDTKIFDTTGSFNTSTNLFTCPTSGTYEVMTNLFGSSGGGVTIYVKQAGVSKGMICYFNTTYFPTNGKMLLQCNQGDTIGIYTATAVTLAAIIDSQQCCWLEIKQVN